MAKGGSKGVGRGSSAKSKANLRNSKKDDAKKDVISNKMALVDKMQPFQSDTEIKPNKISFKDPLTEIIGKENGGMVVQAKISIQNGDVKNVTITDSGQQTLEGVGGFKSKLKKHGGNYEVLGAARNVNNQKIKDAIDNKTDAESLVYVVFKDDDIVK